MDVAATWHALADNFAELAKSGEARKLYIALPPEGWEPAPRWQLAGSNSHETRTKFLAFAERAGVLLGAPAGPEALDRWYELLQLESSYVDSMTHQRMKSGNGEIEAEGKVIRPVCVASEEQCHRMETRAIAETITRPIPTASAVPKQTITGSKAGRRAFIEPILTSKGWSVLDWASEAKVAHATAMDFLDEKTKPYSSTRLKLARSLGIKIEDFPA